MKIVFFGTPDNVIPVLNVLHKTFSSVDGSCIKAVVTQPPQPTGRQKINTFSAVDNWAYKKSIPRLYTPQDVLREKVPADIAILAAYGAIIPNDVINYFPYGILNVHPSLLPKLRGASPVQSTLTIGEDCGVTIIKLDEKMDHGPIVTQFKDTLEENDTLATLRVRLFEKSAEVIKTLLPAYIKGKVNLKPQDHELATFTRLIKRDDGFVDWKFLKSAITGEPTDYVWDIPYIKNYQIKPTPINIDRFVRALTPWPGAWTKLEIGKTGKRLKILEVKAHNDNLEIITVQLEGKNPVSWKQFLEVYKVV
ncbi:methionyl-tRNA formyltransferase [Candidatus Woesebacteria bacterium]|nr:MAG: methionyl-tRNA formyltransferase [Candidatus Woesebacteria bacterium]